MCGRYFIDLDDPELLRIAAAIEEDVKDKRLSLPVKTSGEIFPKDVVPVQTGPSQFQIMTWGFLGYRQRLIINARSETALEKPLFKKAMEERRCLLPASAYYEWKGAKGNKQRYIFTLPDQPLFMAGCYRLEKDAPLPSFVILTRDAAPALLDIHPRMPVIIARDKAAAWLLEGPAAMEDPLLDLHFQPSDGFRDRLDSEWQEQINIW